MWGSPPPKRDSSRALCVAKNSKMTTPNHPFTLLGRMTRNDIVEHEEILLRRVKVPPLSSVRHGERTIGISSLPFRFLKPVS
mmetsp:Transcript_6420/g.12857  ORF Transcript_6420/g.12857 Transcript_6420/m.12857 type:complete len:82 (-) Transcript_6420:134-379(-)